MNKKTNEPIKHHWIPQFILRNFADKNGYVNFHNKKTGKEEYLLPKEIFVYDNLYRDEKNNPDLPVEIEKNLASLEGDVAPIINKLLIGDEIVLSKAEEELLKVFVFVMNFRSKYSYNFFARRISEDSKIRYSEFQKDGDMESYWKRNLCQLAKCRTIEEIHNNANIDKYIKGFVWQDIDGFEGSYFMICRRKGNTDFVLSDVYPLLYEFENALFMKYEIYYLPVSPERVLILMKEFLSWFLYLFFLFLFQNNKFKELQYLL